MKEIEAEAGEHVASAARKLVAASREEDCFLIFNGICLTATRHSTAEGIEKEYDRLSDLRQAEYHASDEGKATKARMESERVELQILADRLMSELLLLDFTDRRALIAWLVKIEPARDRTGVHVDGRRIQQTFVEHGYEPNAYCGNEFEKGNPEIEQRWLIGQAIADVYVPLVRSFAEKIVW